MTGQNTLLSEPDAARHLGISPRALFTLSEINSTASGWKGPQFHTLPGDLGRFYELAELDRWRAGLPPNTTVCGELVLPAPDPARHALMQLLDAVGGDSAEVAFGPDGTFHFEVTDRAGNRCRCDNAWDLVDFCRLEPLGCGAADQDDVVLPVEVHLAGMDPTQPVDHPREAEGYLEDAEEDGRFSPEWTRSELLLGSIASSLIGAAYADAAAHFDAARLRRAEPEGDWPSSHDIRQDGVTEPVATIYDPHEARACCPQHYPQPPIDGIPDGA